MSVQDYHIRQSPDCHGNFQINSFCNLCRIAQRQMLACLRAFSIVREGRSIF